MAMDFGSIISPYMNTGSLAARRDHTLQIKDSDSVASKALKEAINRVNAAGNQPQNARGTSEKSKSSDGEVQSRSDLNQAVRKMSADDIRSLFYMMSSAFGGYGGLF